MKSLSLSRPLVIMVIGLPGSGKSFFARQFASMFGAPLVSADYVRHSLSAESTFDAQEDAIVQTLIQNQIEELCKTGKTFVIDGGINHRTNRTAIERLSTAQGYGRMVIWVQTDEPTSLSRSVKRNDKRAGDMYNDPMPQPAFLRYRKQFSAPSRSEHVVVISGKHTFSTQARVVLKKLVSPREAIVVNRPAEPRQTADTKSENQHDVQPRRRNVTIN